MAYLLLAKEVSDLDGLAIISNASVDRKVSINEPHLVAETLGDTSDEILDVTEGGADGGRGFPGTEPGVDLELLLTVLIGDEIEIKVEMLKITDKLTTRAFDFDDLGVNLDANAVGDVHGFGRKNSFHFDD